MFCTPLRFGGLLVLLALSSTIPLHAQDATINCGEVSGVAGDTVVVPITIDAADIVPTGASFGIAHDEDLLTLESISMGADVAAYDDDEGPSFFVANVDPVGGTGGYVAFIALDSTGSITPFPAIDDLEVCLFEYSISDDAEADSSSDLEFTDELAHSDGAPPVAIVVVHGIERSNLTLEDGEIDVVPGTVNILGEAPAQPFLRGDANGNGTVDGLTDGLFLLRYGFQEGTEPPCFDAADADDGGSVSGLSDGLFLLRWGFQEGTPPPEPGTDSCGTDPTDDDDLGCDVAADVCVE